MPMTKYSNSPVSAESAPSVSMPQSFFPSNIISLTHLISARRPQICSTAAATATAVQAVTAMHSLAGIDGRSSTDMYSPPRGGE